MIRTFGIKEYNISLWRAVVGSNNRYTIHIRTDRYKLAGADLIDSEDATKDKIWDIVEKICEKHHLPLNIVIIDFNDFATDTFSEETSYSEIRALKLLADYTWEIRKNYEKGNKNIPDWVMDGISNYPPKDSAPEAYDKWYNEYNF